MNSAHKRTQYILHLAKNIQRNQIFNCLDNKTKV